MIWTPILVVAGKNSAKKQNIRRKIVKQQKHAYLLFYAYRKFSHLKNFYKKYLKIRLRLDFCDFYGLFISIFWAERGSGLIPATWWTSD